VDEVVSLYFQGRLTEAELLALRTLQSGDSLPPVDREILHKTLGFTYVAMGENEKAREQFISWLEIDPRAALDSLYVSPKIIDVFRLAQEALAQRRQSANPDFSHLTSQMSALKRSLIFPGLGQIYRDQQGKGIALFASEVLLLGGLAYFHVQSEAARNDYMAERSPAKTSEAYDRYNTYYRARNLTAALAAGVYLYSLVDAIYFPPRRGSGLTFPLTFQVTPDPGHSLVLAWRF